MLAGQDFNMALACLLFFFVFVGGVDIYICKVSLGLWTFLGD